MRMDSMPTPMIVIVVTGFISMGCWWIVALRMKQIPRPNGYRAGILRRYKESFPRSPLPWIIRACSGIFYGALALWAWHLLRH
jgi:hypothetical protein